MIRPALALSLALLAAPAGAQTFKAGPLTVEAPWTRATPGGAKVAGGYMRITNGGSAPDRLVGGSIPGAGRSEVHEMSEAGGVMRMAALPKGLEIRPGQTVELSPGGYHLMFLDLSRALKEGERIEGSLTFEKAGSVPVTFAVRSIGARANEAGRHGAHGGGHKH